MDKAREVIIAGIEEWHGNSLPQSGPEMADVILSALSAAGLKVVGREPTDEMQDAARDWSIAKIGHAVGADGSRGCWQAMFAAAPPSPQEGTK